MKDGSLRLLLLLPVRSELFQNSWIQGPEHCQHLLPCLSVHLSASVYTPVHPVMPVSSSSNLSSCCSPAGPGLRYPYKEKS